MRTNPEIQAKLRARLQEAVVRAGSADALGKALGWANGGYVRGALNEKKPRNVTQEFVIRADEASDTWLNGWFDGILPAVARADVMSTAVKRAVKSQWPFDRLTREDWDALGPKGQAIVEDVAVTKARELLAEALLRKRRKIV